MLQMNLRIKFRILLTNNSDNSWFRAITFPYCTTHYIVADSFKTKRVGDFILLLTVFRNILPQYENTILNCSGLLHDWQFLSLPARPRLHLLPMSDLFSSKSDTVKETINCQPSLNHLLREVSLISYLQFFSLWLKQLTESQYSW